jgi:hypothetical protein
VSLLLAAAGVNVNQAMTDGATPLHIAAHKGHAAVAGLLLGALNHACDSRVSAVAGDMVLFEASHEALRLEITNIVGGRSPLRVAFTGGFLQIGASLVLHGACNSANGHLDQAAVERDVISLPPGLSATQLSRHSKGMYDMFKRMVDDHATFTKWVLPAVRMASTPTPCHLHLLRGHEETLLSLVADFAGLVRGRKLRNAREFASFLLAE